MQASVSRFPSFYSSLCARFLCASKFSVRKLFAQAFSAQVSLHLVSLSKCSEQFICVSFLLKICKQVAASRFPAQVSLRRFIFAFFSAQVLYASASCLGKIIYASLPVQVLHANLSAQVPKFLCASSLCEFLKNNFRRLIHERAKQQNRLGFCTPTTPIPAEGREAMLNSCKIPRALRVDHADAAEGHAEDTRVSTRPESHEFAALKKRASTNIPL